MTQHSTHTLDKTVLITGASGAIGQALAVCYAQPGTTLILQGRDEARLEQTAAACISAGAEVRLQALDLSDTEATIAWLETVCAERVPDVFIANAGMNIGIGKGFEGERLEQVAALLDLNVRSTLLMTTFIAARMRRAGAGQIALVSSLAAFYGLPVTPSYSASKAAVKAYGEGLRGALARFGVGVSVIMPGYVDSAMCRGMAGPKPFLWQPQRAAEKIRAAIDANRARLSFPFPLNLGCWFLAVLPAALSQRILRWLDYGG
ncbi:MAG: SDR family NAD(P)-dependent oxidoreductase [Gammaproteobacteria bacterium]|nr:SDR family NAD(P)-dependent oxidoreductase [Gammaproteobacteria bacterium]